MGDVVQLAIAGRDIRRRRKAPPKENQAAMAAWRRHVADLRKNKKLCHADESVAIAATEYPSASYAGVIWPAQASLAMKAGVSLRVVQRAIARLKIKKALTAQRRGDGRSARYVFCIGGIPVIKQVGSAPHDCAVPAPHDHADLSGSAPHDRAERVSYLPDPFERESSPDPQREITASSTVEVEFDEVWRAVVDDAGPLPAAKKAWRRLSTEDRKQVAERIGPEGLDLDGAWLSGWLNERCFAGPILRRNKQRGNIMPAVDRMITELELGGGVTLRRFEELVGKEIGLSRDDLIEQVPARELADLHRRFRASENVMPDIRALGARIRA